MRTITKNVYQFNELNEDAKEKVLRKFSEINVDFEWYDFIFENFKEKAKKYFDVEKIYFSGFWSQGDGAMFEYDYINSEFIDSIIDNLDLPNWKKEILKNAPIYGRGKQKGHYYHYKNCDHDIDFDKGVYNYYENLYNFTNSYLDEIHDEIVEKYEDLCSELYNDLEKENEYLTSEKAIIETIEVNEYEFYEDGNTI